ncbi:MAG: CHAP domain-containing protein [Chlorobiaceae bacterium]|nr:CHAP domain-containing protein [Chlorobiaceae bacterium]
MNYPGRIIKKGDQDVQVVRAIKAQLNIMLCSAGDIALRLDPDNPAFGDRMALTIKLFQARHVDSEGRPLKQDGQVGSLTWAALFGTGSVVVSNSTADGYLAAVLSTASEEERKQVREVPVNSNRGPEVEAYLHRVDVPPGNSWCCAFVYWCFDEAAKSNGRSNPMVKTAGCLDHWNRAKSAGIGLVGSKEAVNSPDLVLPGMVFIMDHGAGKGHTGLVERVEGGLITTIEGNTDASKTREGGGVYRLKRKIVEVNKGFIDYSGA